MKLSYKWLSEYVDLHDITPEELADKMTTAGLEVEGIEKVASGTNLVIGEVMECWDHPDSDHLHVTKTRISENEVTQIVCGAPNCRSGLKVIVALPGSELPVGKIGSKPVRGQESNGMLCSLSELGVPRHWQNEYQLAGIEELPVDAPVGCTDVIGYLGLDDTVLDVSLTPNRADCSSMWNMAKEVGAILNRKVTWPDYAGKADRGEKTDFRLALETERCSCYYGKVINHVKVGPSPQWMVNYLHAAGMNSINNVVDISNFVMLETGQPLHYYDYSKLPHHEITVVDDREMKMTALDGVEFDIQKGDLLITTNGEATGIAGIMGGEESMIDENTSSIFLEAAAFDPVAIRKTSIRLNLITEAAQRFTKGLEPLGMAKAIDRSVQLLEEYCEASGLEETIIAGSVNYTPLSVTETLSHCNGLLGTSFTMEQVREVLERLDFSPEVDGETIVSHIPSYRTDIERAADIDEEVIRLIGFDSLDSTLPEMEATVGMRTPRQAMRNKTMEIMNGFGLHEIITYTLVPQSYVENGFMTSSEAVELAMPMSEARKYVRGSLINSVMECLQYNEAHQNSDNHVFEISSVYGKDTEGERLAVALDGSYRNDPLHHSVQEGDFYVMKGLLLAWLNRLGYTNSRLHIHENKTDAEHFHPYRSAELWLDNSKLGVFGEIHPAYADRFDLKKVTYAELNLDPVFDGKTSKIRYTPLDKYPSVSRDISLVVSREVTAARLLDVIRKAGKKIVRSSEVFDIYEGEHVQEGFKSVALRIIYAASDHTLKEEEISAAHNVILAALAKQLDAKQRA